MSTTDNVTRECNPLGVYSPGESPVLAPLLWVGLVHTYCIIVLGSLGNAIVLWCVATCSKTRRPIKVLLFNVFLPVLVICMVTMPVITEILSAMLTCDNDRIARTVVTVTMVMTSILGQIEQIAIAVMAVVRAVTVWAPRRPQLGVRGAVMLLLATWIYTILTGLVFIKLMKMRVPVDPQAATYTTILFFINLTLPALVTAAVYILMIVVIQRNKRRLMANANQQGTMTTNMDQATRAMLAVFITNLVFGLPHSIYHLLGPQPLYMHVIIHVIFCTHYIVDPLVYMWFNVSYRERLISSFRKVMRCLSSSSTAHSDVQTSTEFTASYDNKKQLTSITHTHFG